MENKDFSKEQLVQFTVLLKENFNGNYKFVKNQMVNQLPISWEQHVYRQEFILPYNATVKQINDHIFSLSNYRNELMVFEEKAKVKDELTIAYNASMGFFNQFIKQFIIDTIPFNNKNNIFQIIFKKHQHQHKNVSNYPKTINWLNIKTEIDKWCSLFSQQTELK